MSTTLTISLTPELKEIVQAKVRSGRYGNVSEVIREALRNWETGDESEDPALEQLVDAGLATKSVPWSKNLLQELRPKKQAARRSTTANKKRK
jgi:putative addiction module CopG family antidote